ncbi:MAG TPA: YrdB family protein [Candidatus Limnocylindrales bacterium]|nr:YrdB family protein [Candidatus Limnocylindrales bacterium]
MQEVKVMGIAALTMRFVVELLGIAAVAYWGWQSGPDGIGRVLLAVGGAVALIVVWGFVVAPKADNPLSQQVRDIIGTVLLLVAAGGLAAVGEPTLAMVFAAVIVIDWVAMVVIGPDASQALRPSAASRR